MNPTKPPSAKAPALPTAARPNGPNGVHLPPMLHGPTFANVLASATAAPKTSLMAPQTQGSKLQTTSLPQAVMGVHAEPEKRGRHHGGEHDADLDPFARQAAQLAPPGALAPSEETENVAAQTNARVSLEELVPQLVKKIAWSGDAQRGTVRMELGAGELAGSTLTVSADNGRVSVHVNAPPGTDTHAWRERLTNRLESRGLAIDTIEVQ